uniref:A-macroglobulin complement component n=1 Tax=Musca domestica TaxID=7370 RepID=A0A1I8MBJ9_MUSDO
MEQMFCFILVLLQILVGGVQANGYYTIVAPGTIQSATEYRVAVAAFDTYETARIKIGISGPSYNETKTIEIPVMGSQLVDFEVPKLREGIYELQTEGLQGLIFRRNATLIFEPYSINVYIQTDKALYRPGDLVQYRIIALDAGAKPARFFEPLTLVIKDSEGNRIKKIKNLEFSKGVHKGKLQLSEHTMLGKWSIEILDVEEPRDQPQVPMYPGFSRHPNPNILPKAKSTKHFEVARYVLPKFSVAIESDKKVAILDRSFKITIRSKYVHGRPVNGHVSVTAYFAGYHGNNGGWPKAEKHMDLVNGKAVTEFHFMQDIILEQYQPVLNLLAIVTEQHTGLQQNSTTTIELDVARYSIDVPQLETSYVANKPFEIRAIIKKLNGQPITNARCTAKLLLDYQPDNYRYNQFQTLIFEADVDRNGLAIFKLNFTRPTYYTAAIMYEEKTQAIGGFAVVEPNAWDVKEKPKHSAPGHVTTVRSAVGPLKVSSRTNNLKLGEEIVLDIASDDPLPYFCYTIMSRGKIVQHDVVTVGGGRKSYELKIQPTFEMAPEVKIFAYLIDDGEMKSSTMTLKVPGTFRNQLLIDSPLAANASDEITLNIKTDPDSYVGLLAVDQSVLLMKSDNDLNGKEIFKDLDKFQSQSPNSNGRHNMYPGKDSGFVTITNGCYQHTVVNHYAERQHYYPVGMTASAPASMSYSAHRATGASYGAQPIVRKHFVETWIFDDIESTDSNGWANFTKTIPDTMTSWIISGFSLNEKTGFGITEKPINITVSHRFFVTTSLPYAVKRGEILQIPAVVFNNMNVDVEAEVSLENSHDEFDFVNAQGEIMTEPRLSHQLEVKSNSEASVSFRIYPKVVGEITLTLKAISPLAGDAIQQKLKVEPEGITQYKKEVRFLNSKQSESLSHTFEAQIPSNAVGDSEYLELIAVGDIVGPALENFENTEKMPFFGGGAEDNIMVFTRNLLILQYLEIMQLERPQLKESIKSNMETAYQRQLSYKLANGGYCRFSRYYCRDQTDNRVTAQVARSFIQAQKYITIDRKIIDKALEYLADMQTANGGIARSGYNFDGSEGMIETTAHVLLAFLEDKDYRTRYRQQISKGVQYLAHNSHDIPDNSSLALTSLVFHKVNHPSLTRSLEHLDFLWTYWSTLNLRHERDDLETMAYYLQILLETSVTSADDNRLLAIVKFLINRDNNQGGYAAGAVTTLESLVKFAQKYNTAAKDNINIQFEARNQAETLVSQNSFQINGEDDIHLKSFELPKETRKLSVSAQGAGSGLLQFTYRYNVMSAEENTGFNLTYELRSDDSKDYLQMTICAEYTPLDIEGEEEEDGIASNMAVMDIHLPSGYKIHENVLEKLLDVERIQNVNGLNENTMIRVYFDSLARGQRQCLTTTADRYHQVEKLQPAVITIYDYYDITKRAMIFYDIKNALSVE